MAELKYDITSDQLAGALKQQEKMAKDVSAIASFFRIARFVLPFIIVPTLLTIAASLVCPNHCKTLPEKANKAFDKGVKKGMKLAKSMPEKVKKFASKYPEEAGSID